MRVVDLFSFLFPLLFFAGFIFLASKINQKSLPEMIEKSPFLKDLIKSLASQATATKKPATPVTPVTPLPSPTLNSTQVKSSLGNVLRGILLIALLMVGLFYIRRHWGLF